MFKPTRFFLAAAVFFAPACSSTKEDDADEPLAVPTLTDAVPVPVATGESERFVIRDKQQRIRVDGRVRGGQMDGTWVYFDSRGEKLAVINYKLDQRHGPAHLYYVSADGPAAGRVRMSGSYIDGMPNGMVESRWASGGKKLERDFDRGILQGSRGWSEKGARLSDGAAMAAAIEEGRNEEALLTELENFVQLQLRKKGAAPADTVPNMELESPRANPGTAVPGPVGAPSLSNP